MNDLFKFCVVVIGTIVLLWEMGSLTFRAFTEPKVPTKPTSGYERLESACIAYIQAMPVCESAYSRELPSYLSDRCKSYINKNIVHAPGC